MGSALDYGMKGISLRSGNSCSEAACNANVEVKVGLSSYHLDLKGANIPAEFCKLDAGEQLVCALFHLCGSFCGGHFFSGISSHPDGASSGSKRGGFLSAGMGGT